MKASIPKGLGSYLPTCLASRQTEDNDLNRSADTEGNQRAEVNYLEFGALQVCRAEFPPRVLARQRFGLPPFIGESPIHPVCHLLLHTSALWNSESPALAVDWALDSHLIPGRG